MNDQTKANLFSIEAEQAVLGALLLNNDVADSLTDLSREHFYDPVHAFLFDAIMTRILAGKFVSPVTLKLYVSHHNGLQQLGGSAYLVHLAGAAISVSAAPDYAESIRACYAMRRLRDEAQEFVELIETSPDAPVDDLIDDIASRVATVRREIGRSHLMTDLPTALNDGATRVNDAYHGMAAGAPFGLDAVTEFIGPLAPGAMIMIGARTSMGKTALALEIAGASLAAGSAVHLTTLEMPAYQIGHRMMSRALALAGHRIEYARIAQGRIDTEEYKRYLHVASQVSGPPLYISESSVAAVERWRSAVRQAKSRSAQAGHKLGLAIVDYFQLLRVVGQRSKTDELTIAARELKAASMELGIPVVVLAQVKREVEDRKGDHRPRLDDIKWAGEAEEAADVVAFLYRHSWYLFRRAASEEGERRSETIAEAYASRLRAEIIIAKNRHGPTGTAHVACDLTVNRFADTEAGLIANGADQI